MARDLDGAIAERSRTLLGLLTVAHLDALGVSRQQRRTLVARGVLIPVHGRVFRHAAHPQSWRQSTLAAVLAAGDGAVASHLTAATLWRFDTVTAGAIEVSVPAARRATAGGFVVHRSCDLLLADRQPHVVISRTTPARQASAERASRLKLAGWDVVTFTYEDVVERPEYVVEAIRAHLGQA